MVVKMQNKQLKYGIISIAGILLALCLSVVCRGRDGTDRIGEGTESSIYSYKADETESTGFIENSTRKLAVKQLLRPNEPQIA